MALSYKIHKSNIYNEDEYTLVAIKIYMLKYKAYIKRGDNWLCILD